MDRKIVDPTVIPNRPVIQEGTIGTRDIITKDAPAQVFLQPIAPPSILGLFGFAVATMMVSTNMLGWYGSSWSGVFIAPFAAFFGGLAQFMAGLWSFRARDGLAVAMHGMWGSFWMAYGLLFGLLSFGAIAIPANGLFQEMGIWFVGLAWVTWIGAWAATRVNFSLLVVLILLAGGSTAAAIANFSGSLAAVKVAGWMFLISAVAAWYTASALMLESVFGLSILPLGKTHKLEHAPQIAAGIGEPGVTHGQV